MCCTFGLDYYFPVELGRGMNVRLFTFIRGRGQGSENPEEVGMGSLLEMRGKVSGVGYPRRKGSGARRNTPWKIFCNRKSAQ